MPDGPNSARWHASRPEPPGVGDLITLRTEGRRRQLGRAHTEALSRVALEGAPRERVDSGVRPSRRTSGSAAVAPPAAYGPAFLAGQPVSAVRGVTPEWQRQLECWGYLRVGDLAYADPGEFMARGVQRIPELLTLMARARTLCSPWPADLPTGRGRSVADVALGCPVDAAGARLRDHCIGLLAALDLEMAETITIL